jgi:hypothetical protein
LPDGGAVGQAVKAGVDLIQGNGVTDQGVNRQLAAFIRIDFSLPTNSVGENEKL